MPHRSRTLLPYAVLVVSLVLTGIAALAPLPGQPVAAVFPPWWGAARAFAAAARSNSPVVRLGLFPNIVILPGLTTGASSRLHRAGALLLLNAQALGACASRP